MRRLVTAEIQKLYTTRLWLWLLLASTALTALYVGLSIAFGDDPGNPTPSLASPEGQRTVLALASSGSAPLVTVLAAIGITGEHRHRTATTTYLTTPRRHRVVLAKLVTYALVGAGYGIAASALATAITLPWLAARGIDVTLTAGGIPATLIGVVATSAAFAVLGVGLGALVGEQVATVVGLLIYLYVAEPVVTRIPALQNWTAYLPGMARNAVTNAAYSDLSLLGPWQGGLVLASYAAAFALAGIGRVAWRDIT